MPVPNRRRLREALDELAEYLERLREVKSKAEAVDRALAEIDELREVLDRPEGDPIRAFKLMRMFVEKMKDLDPGVPLLGTFLELYVAALRSAERLLDGLMDDLGFLGDVRRSYCKARRAIEEQLAKEDLDEETADREAHARTLRVLGFPFDRYGDDLRRWWELKQRKKQVEAEREQAEADARALGQGAQPAPVPVAPRPPTPEPMPVEPEPIRPPPPPTCCDRHGDEDPEVDASGLTLERTLIEGRLIARHPCGIRRIRVETWAFLGRASTSQLIQRSDTPNDGEGAMDLAIRTRRLVDARRVYVIVTVVSTCGTVRRIGYMAGGFVERVLD